MGDRRIRVANLLFQRMLSGAPRAALDAATRLDRDRFQSDLVCAGEGEVASMARDAGMPVHFVADLVWGRIQPWRDLKAVVRLTRLFRRERYDVVHTHSSKSGFVGRLAAKLAGVPVICHTVQGFAFHEFSGGLKDELYIWLERLVGRFTRGLIFVNDDDMRLARRRKIGKPKYHARLTNGVDLDRWPEVAESDRDALRETWLGADRNTKKLLVFVGRLAPQKGPVDLIEAATKVGEKRRDVVFLMVGEGELGEELEALVSERGVEDLVRFSGWRQDVPDILRAADYFCLPSYWEGLPLVLLEAMAARVPVIASDIKGNRELIEHEKTGLLFEAGDIPALADELERLAGDPEFAGQLARAARAKLEKSYSMRALVDSVEELYARLLEESKA